MTPRQDAVSFRGGVLQEDPAKWGAEEDWERAGVVVSDKSTRSSSLTWT